MTWIKPAVGRISSPFGKRVAPTAGASTFHYGADIAANNGSECMATADGIVTVAGLTGGFGGLVVISHGGGHTTYCAHLSQIDVKPRQKVVQGQRIGLTGGRLGQWGAGTSTGSHCHTEHHVNGTPVDPVPYWATISTASLDPAPIKLPIGERTMIKIVAPTRGQAVIGAGYFRHLENDEEVHAADLIVDRAVVGTDRQYDVWHSIALFGYDANSADDETIKAAVNK